MGTVRGVVRSAAAVLVVAAAGLVAMPAVPASAATCSSAHGVSVVVDFHQLGGGVQAACLAGSRGGTAASLFETAGFHLDYVANQPGFVCRVSGKPSTDPCQHTPPSNAYWGLWWSNGTSGSWTYASAGAGSQHVPDGGSVAFSWNGSSTRSQPGVAPARHTTTSPSSSPTPSGHGSGSGSGSGGAGSAGSGASHGGTSSSAPAHPASSSPAPASSGPESASGSATGAASGRATHSASGAPKGGHHRPAAEHGAKAGRHTAGARPGRHRHRAAVATTPESSSATASPSPAAAPTADPTDPGEGLPSWVAPAALVVLAAGAGAAALVRRRRAPGS